MPRQELEDFARYWQESMIDSQTNLPRPAGGVDTVIDGIRGVDYSESLIPWCKGNSVSVDQNTLHFYRTVMQALFENYRTRLRLVDARPKVIEIDSSAGITIDRLETFLGGHTQLAVPYQWNEPTELAHRAEQLFANLLIGGAIRLYGAHNEVSSEEGRLVSDILAGRASQDDWISKGIIAQLLSTKNSGGHVRLSFDFGWETYIRDHWGAPSGIAGVIPGSLQAGVDSYRRTMSNSLHIVLAETLARAHSKRDDLDEWGKNQTLIRREIADGAIDGDGDRIPLDDYYYIFAKHGAMHMADSFFYRWVSDNSAARYEVSEIQGSSPKRWDVLLEPEFVRWRELRRERERLL